MPIEQMVKGTTGFLSILTKRYQLLLVMFFIAMGVSVTIVMNSDLPMEYKLFSIIGMVILTFVAILVLPRLASREDETLLKERAEHSVNLQKDVEILRSTQKSIEDANKQIREWKINHPPLTMKGLHPFGNGVKVELKETPTGAYYAVLHITGEAPEKYRLYK